MTGRKVDAEASAAMWAELDALANPPKAESRGDVEQPVVMEPGISRESLIAWLIVCGIAVAGCVTFIVDVWLGMRR